MDNNLFIEELKKININITKKQLSDLNIYYEMLEEKNKYINLTTITNKNDVYLKHFYDSLTLNKVVDLKNIDNLCDIGTGAGFPGMVIKILFPNIEITLVDSLKKRLNFLEEVVNKLDLKKINIIHSRAEDYGLKTREKYDIVTARAVANMNTLLEYAIPLVKKNGYFIAMKGNVTEEMKNISSTLMKLDSIIEKIIEFKLPVEESQRTLIKIKKTKETNKKFPRKYIEIKNKPL